MNNFHIPDIELITSPMCDLMRHVHNWTDQNPHVIRQMKFLLCFCYHSASYFQSAFVSTASLYPQRFCLHSAFVYMSLLSKQHFCYHSGFYFHSASVFIALLFRQCFASVSTGLLFPQRFRFHSASVSIAVKEKSKFCNKPPSLFCQGGGYP